MQSGAENSERENGSVNSWLFESSDDHSLPHIKFSSLPSTHHLTEEIMSLEQALAEINREISADCKRRAADKQAVKRTLVFPFVLC
jgi:hypothetical protein